MTRALAICVAVFAAAAPSAPPAFGDTIVAARTIRARAIITPADVTRIDGNVAGTVERVDQVLGLEARVALYAGRPIRVGDVGPAATVERNQIVRISYRAGGLTIATEGRALERGGPGDIVRVMNLTSRATVAGTILSDGSLAVGAAGHN